MLPSPKRRAGLIRYIIPGFALLAGTMGLAKIRSLPDTVVSPIPEESVTRDANPFTFFFTKKKSFSELEERIKLFADARFRTYSVVVHDYKTGERIALGDTIMFTGASINKVPILATLYVQTLKGIIDIDSTITLQAGDIQNYGTGSIQYESPGTVYSLKTLARLMIQKSDNTAAYILSTHVLGLETIQMLLSQWGLTQTDMENNKTSNRDMELLFEMLYREKLAPHAVTQEMLTFFTDTDFEDRLPAQLPPEATVYHKIGTEVGVLHDVGIVEGPGRSYYIGIFTGDVEDEKATIEAIAQLSKMVYDWMGK